MRTTTFPARRAPVVALLITLAAACGSDGSTSTAVDAPTTSVTTTAAPSTTTAGTPTTGAADDADPAEPATPPTFEADAPLLTKQFQAIEPGTYRVDTLGTPVSITVGDGMFVQPNSEAFFVLSDEASQGPDDRDLVFLRVSALADPTDPGAPPAEQEGWPAEDFNGWLDTVVDIEVSDRQTLTVGGLEAIRVDLRLAESAECRPNNFFSCIGLATNRLINGKELVPGSTLRVWWVDQEAQSPLMLIAGATNERDAAWFDVADEMVATVAFGEIAPNPIPEGDLLEAGFSGLASAGAVELPILGGVSFTLAEEEFINQFSAFDYAAIGFGERAASTEMFVVARTLPLIGTPEEDWAASEPIDSTDEAIAWLTEAGATLTELDGAALDGVPARVFDIEASAVAGPPPALMQSGVTAADGFGWFAPTQGRLWFAETALGVLVVTAETFDSPDDLTATIERTEAIVATLDLAEIG